MGKTTKYNLTLKGFSPAVMAEYHSTVAPLGGVLRDRKETLIPRVRHIRSRWIVRCSELLQAGWSSIQSKKFMYARNCPPCSVWCEPPQRVCTLKICPFCHARKVSNLYYRMRKFIDDLDQPVKVISFRFWYGHEWPQVDPIYFDAYGGFAAAPFTAMLNKHRNYRAYFQKKHMQQALGGAYWWSLAPYTFKEDAIDGSCGRWYALHSCVAVMPADWEPWKSTKSRRVIRCISDPNDYQLAWLIGRAFQYRSIWLTCNPSVMTEFLNTTLGEKFLSTFGELRSKR